MDRDPFDSTVRTTDSEITGPIKNPGRLVECTASGMRETVLARSIMVLGNDVSADVVIEERSIASYHAEILHEDDVYRLRHVDGRKKVRVNGEAVIEALLGDGDEISIGSRTFVFKASTGTKPATE